jgi:hypothetical protein
MQRSHQRTLTPLAGCLAAILAVPLLVSPLNFQREKDAKQKAKEILELATEAAGGDSLTKVNSLELTLIRVAFLERRQQSKSKVGLRLVYPSQIRLVESLTEDTGPHFQPDPQTINGLPDRETAAGFAYYFIDGCDGSVCWEKRNKVIHQQPFSRSAQFRIDLFGGIGLIRRAAQGKLDASFEGEENMKGQHVYVLDLPEFAAKIYVDSKKHLFVAAKYRGQGPKGSFDVLVCWKDHLRIAFKEGGQTRGVQVPRRWVTYRDGKKFLDENLDVRELLVNAKQDPKLFVKPK